MQATVREAIDRLTANSRRQMAHTERQVSRKSRPSLPFAIR